MTKKRVLDTAAKPALELTVNQRRILDALSRQQNVRRNDLADELEFSPQTMMRAVNPLVERGVVTEVEELSGARGKPPRLMSVRPGALLAVGITIDEGRVVVDLTDFSGRRITRNSVTRDFTTARAQIAVLFSSITDVFQDCPSNSHVVAATAVVQGYFLQPGRKVVSRSDPHGWSQIDLHQELSDFIGLPVSLINDGRAFAGSLIGQCGSQNFLALLLGSGIGGGSVVDGRLLGGATGNAGEFGRFFGEGEYRPTETAAKRAASLSDWSMWRGLDALPADQKAQLAIWLDEAATALSRALELCAAVTDFDKVILGSRMPEDILQAIADRIEIRQLGVGMWPTSSAFALPTPAVEIHHIESMSRLAGQIAMKSFLEPEHFKSEDEAAFGKSETSKGGQ